MGTAKEHYRFKGNDYKRIFDTTLRDGRQAPGCAMTTNEVLKIAMALDQARIDIIEACIPTKISDSDKESDNPDKNTSDETELLKKVVQSTQYSTIASFSRIGKLSDIDAGADGLKEAILQNRARMALVTRTSKKRFLDTAGIDYEYVKQESINGMLHAMDKFFELKRAPDIQIYFEGATEAEEPFLIELGRLLIDEFNKKLTSAPKNMDVSTAELTLDICDTHGTSAIGDENDNVLHHNFSELTAKIFSELKIDEADNVTGAIHCHNDFGRATGNAMGGLYGITGQVDVTIAGLGERAGNTRMLNVVGGMNQANKKLAERHEEARFEMGIKLKDMHNLENLINIIVFREGVQKLLSPHIKLSEGAVDDLTQQLVGLIKRTDPFNGDNIASSSAGIHLNLLKKNARAYNTIEPEEYGATSQLVKIGPMMGRSGVELALLIENTHIPKEVISAIWENFEKSGIHQMSSKDFIDQFVYRDPKIIELIESLNNQRIKIKHARIIEEWGEGLMSDEIIEAILKLGKHEIKVKGNGRTLIGTMENKIEEITGYKFTVPEGGFKAHSTKYGGQSPVISMMQVIRGDEIRVGFGIHGKNNGANLKAYLAAVSQFLKEDEEVD